MRAKLGIERWETTGSGSAPAAWWDGTSNPDDERIMSQTRELSSQTAYQSYGNRDHCQQIIRIVMIPFFKTFVGGASAGGRFGTGDEFDSCGVVGNRSWIPQPTSGQGAWGHSAVAGLINPVDAAAPAAGAQLPHTDHRGRRVLGGAGDGINIVSGQVLHLTGDVAFKKAI